jgi:hypothetical protein
MTLVYRLPAAVSGSLLPCRVAQEALTSGRAPRQRFHGKPMAVCIETSRGPLVYALQKHDFLVLFPINPATLARYRQAFKPSRAKADPTDAQIALEILMGHPTR